MPEVYMAWAIDWIESERGWGKRPDGTSFHETKEAAEQYIKDYWARQPDRGPGGSVPDEYTSPGKPHGVIINDADLRRRIEDETNVMFSQYRLRGLTKGAYETVR